jgi:hypothetical protein
MNVNRSLIGTKLVEFADKYYIKGSTSKIVISKTQELADPKYRRNSMIVISSDVTVPFEALTDEDVYAFIRTISEELPGIVKFKSFSIKRDSKITDQVIRTITKEGKYRIVSGDLSFVVYGMRPPETAKGSAADPNIPNFNLAPNANP